MARAEQTEIPGTERPKLKAVEDAAEAYRDVVTRRLKLQEKEDETADAL
jgi:hypothetical protein